MVYPKIYWFYYEEIKQYSDKAISSGEIAPMIDVTPDANFESKRINYFNDPVGDFNFEDFFMKEFISYLEKNYRCRTEKDSRAIAGASMGRDVFSYFEGLTENTESKTKWFICCGDDDRLSTKKPDCN